MYMKSEREMTHEALQSYRQALSEGDTAGGFTKHLLLTRAGYWKEDSPIISAELEEMVRGYKQ